MTGGVMALAALGVAAGNWAVYWPKIKAMRVPLRPVGQQVVMVVAIVLAVAALVRGTGTLGGVAALLAIAAAAMFLFFTLNSTMPHAVPKVGVGDPILDFTTPTADGEEFTLSSLFGAPFLLKFFRGHW